MSNPPNSNDNKIMSSEGDLSIDIKYPPNHQSQNEKRPNSDRRTSNHEWSNSNHDKFTYNTPRSIQVSHGQFSNRPHQQNFVYQPDNRNSNIPKPNDNHTNQSELFVTKPKPRGNITIQPNHSIPIKPPSALDVQKPNNSGLVIVKKPSQSSVLDIKVPNGKEIKIEKDKDKSNKIQFDAPNKKPTTIAIERNTSPKNLVILTLPSFQPNVLNNIGKKIRKSNQKQKFERNSRGYVLLMNYLADLQSSSTDTYSKKYSNKANYSRSSRKAEASLVDSTRDDGNTAYLPSHFLKKAEMWDEDTDEAFQINVRTLFNRLTAKQLDDVLSKLLDKLTTSEKREFAAESFVQKAASEKNYSKLFAEFVKKCTDTELNSKIQKSAINKFYDWSANPGNGESDCEICSGYAAFVGALLELNIISAKSTGLQMLEKLLNYLEEDNIHPHHVEMLKSFILSAGINFTKTVEKKKPGIWEKLNLLANRKDIPSRLHFLLLDVEEVKNKWLKNEQVNLENKIEVKEKPKKEEISSLVRSAFSTFQEDDSKIPSEIEGLSFYDFLNSALDILPDQTHDTYDFCYFVAYFMTEKKPKVALDDNNIINLLNDYVAKFANEDMVEDVPKIWQMFTMLLLQMIIKSIISMDKATKIHEAIPGSGKWNMVNDMKWYLDDYHDFYQPIHIEGKCTMEIVKALEIPATIQKEFNENYRNNFKMSKLIAIAIVRSVFAKLRYIENPTVNDIKKYVPYLSIAMEKLEKIVLEAIDAEMDGFDEFSFSKEEVINLIKNKNV
ncbi:MIF4G domain containing protein [Histomonas meleagridis]|uniref:MIF4G domain containing protein n=1 Tax=Histomonas meleagridis TaxID=135588 RepID=UPI00355A1E28|nr:MIF4G domain containing protein [Histomonas meleagridis]KAH0804839.1 MIF4G domain containing protein [Histomonas meleagridis]